MTFAQQITSDAAALILVDGADIGTDPSDSALLTRFLNDYCAELFDLGIDFGYRPVVDPGDPITSPTSVDAALKFNLASRASSVFGLPLLPGAAAEALRTEKRLKANFMRRPKGRLPSTLPMGAGNIGRSGSSSDFYPFGLPRGFLRLDSSSTVTISAIDTPVQVGGWVVDSSVNVTASEDGSIEFHNEGPYLALLEASLTVNAAAGDQFTFYFAKNGAILEQSALVFDADKSQNLFPKWAETLRRGDVITLLVANNTDTTNITLTNGHLRLT